MSILNRLVLHEINAERDRQDVRWGEQNHDDLFWLGILTEELGEVAKEIIEGIAHNHPTMVRAELVQVAAVAVAWVECLDRRSPPTVVVTEPPRRGIGRIVSRAPSPDLVLEERE